MTNGITALCDTLRAVGIDCVFGIPGTQNVSLFEGFRRARLRTVLASHELAAAFMANGYFRATGRVAALATIPGPGFTYTITGLAEARLDSAGLLYLVGKPATNPGRRFQSQAIDQWAIAAPLVKACFALESPRDVSRVIRDAHALAVAGEPGPVMVELDVAALSIDDEKPGTRESPQGAHPPEERFEQLEALFARSTRPVFLLGQGAVASAARLRQIAEALTIPVVTTPSARGLVPEDHPLAMGFDPLRGHTGELNRLFERSDLVLGLGCKLSHNGSSGFQVRLPPDRFVHVDAERDVLGANYDARLAVTARIEEVLTALEARHRATEWNLDELRVARESLRVAPADQVEPLIRGPSTIKPAEFFSWLRGLLPRDAIVVTDSGLHQILTRRHFDVLAPRGLICPTDFQSMGFGLPAAIGAKLADPGRLVVALVGDGGFLMSGLELLTARRECAPLVTFVFNDGQLNQIRLQQLENYGHAHAVRLLNPDYRALAAALGIEYLRFGESPPDEIERALHDQTVALIEVIVGDSLSMRSLPPIARAKALARGALSPGLRNWLKTKFRRGRSA